MTTICKSMIMEYAYQPKNFFTFREIYTNFPAFLQYSLQLASNSETTKLFPHVLHSWNDLFRIKVTSKKQTNSRYRYINNGRVTAFTYTSITVDVPLFTGNAEKYCLPVTVASLFHKKKSSHQHSKLRCTLGCSLPSRLPEQMQHLHWRTLKLGGVS